MQNGVYTQYIVWISVVSHPYIVELLNFATAPIYSERSRLCAVKPNENAERRKPVQKLNLVEAETLLYEPLEKSPFVVEGQ